MRSWILDFRLNQPPAEAPPAGPDVQGAPSATDVDWPLRLQAAQGDDAALLALTREPAPLDVKLAAVAALASEEALKAAEHEFRHRDRRVHRLAKQRHGLAVAQREARAQADHLIEAARALSAEDVIYVNHLVDLDRAWQALDTQLLAPTQRSEYDALMARMAQSARERADQPLKLRRWSDQARAALQALRQACTEAAGGVPDRGPLTVAVAAAREAAAAAPSEAALVALRDELVAADALGVRLAERLALLDEVLGQPPAAESTEAGGETADAAAVAPGTTPGGPRDALRRWIEAQPLGDERLDALLQQRFEQWQQGQRDAAAARRAQQREQARSRQRVVRDERIQALGAVLELAEAAIAAGQLARTHEQLVEIDRLVHEGAAAADLRGRIAALQARYAQLKGWQHWAGGRARDDLVQEAEALAAASRGPTEVHPAKLTTAQLAEAVDDMRARWKELDRLGGATSRSLWQRFDAALKTAYEPVSTQIAVQRAAREQNLHARQALLEGLERVPPPGSDEGTAAPDWRALAGTLEHFRTEWRRLGPIEHTVPHKARVALLERMAVAVQRLEAPLQEVRRAAQREREDLVARARALASEHPGRDLVDKVRELQAQWQQHARTLPLARADETALWRDFKAAIDDAFGAREAAFKARDAEFRAHAAERQALIDRLRTLTAESPAAQLKRSLAEVDAQWQRAGPAPRSDAAELDARYRQVRADVQRWLAESGQRGWHATCDALLAKLALCEELEGHADPAAARAELAGRWSGGPALPAPLEAALADRAGLPHPARRAGAATAAASTDDLLLRLELAWGLDSPPAFEEARRLLKLQAMKAALETRRAAPAPVAATPMQWLAELLRCKALDAVQRERRHAVLAELRRRGPIDGMPRSAT